MMTERPFSEESAAVKRRLFTLGLLLSTWIPMACLIAAGFYETPSRGFQATQTTLVFINGLHVAATLCLYVDSQFLRLIRQNQARYVYFPLAVSIGSGVIFALGSLVMQAYWLLIYWAWQAYHYGRQNIGVYSFASIAQGRRVGHAERRALELAIGCGICGTFKILGMGVAPSYLHDVFDGLYRLGAVAFVGVLGLSAYVYIANRKHLSLTQTAFFFTLILFFGPIFLSTNVTVAFSSYAVAHGIQYMVFMTVLAFNIGTTEGGRCVSKRMMILVTLMVIMFSGLGYWMPDLRETGWGKSSVVFGTALDFVAGMILGTAAAHFVVDAGAWRLSQPSVRTYVAKRFEFLFKPAVADRAT